MTEQREGGDPEAGMPDPNGRPAGFGLTLALSVYLVTMAVVACAGLITIFPSSPVQPDVASGVAANGGAVVAPAPKIGLRFGDLVVANHTLVEVRSPDQGLLLLALLSGVLGSFLHASQSLVAYVGNRQLRASWALWYALRPPIGGILGLLFYFIVRAGFIPATSSATSTSAMSDAVSPYGVVAFGALAGWFSKRSTDKLAEVFETLFRTAKDLEYKDKLSGAGRPRITRLDPPAIAFAAHNAGDVELVVVGERFAPGAWATIDGHVIPTRPIDATHLACVIPKSLNLIQGQRAKVTIHNPAAPNAPPSAKDEPSDPVEVEVR